MAVLKVFETHCLATNGDKATFDEHTVDWAP